ncbi:MAG: hypothetical protein LQ342_008560 [Letrouitia transgressa]|nr:MAG: hypothetical protein LQ342_008560 [Letrouitia transgressa]
MVSAGPIVDPISGLLPGSFNPHSALQPSENNEISPKELDKLAESLEAGEFNPGIVEDLIFKELEDLNDRIDRVDEEELFNKDHIIELALEDLRVIAAAAAIDKPVVLCQNGTDNYLEKVFKIPGNFLTQGTTNGLPITPITSPRSPNPFTPSSQPLPPRPVMPKKLPKPTTPISNSPKPTNPNPLDTSTPNTPDSAPLTPSNSRNSSPPNSGESSSSDMPSSSARPPPPVARGKDVAKGKDAATAKMLSLQEKAAKAKYKPGVLAKIRK